MEFRNSKEDKRIYGDFDRLYAEAFPKEEQLPLSFLKRKAKSGVEDCFGLYEEGNFIGLLCCAYDRDIVFVFYFAISQSVRGKGYGTRVLEELKQRFPGKRLLLTIEILDENSPNNEQRKKRRAFYLRCGFRSCCYRVIERGVVYETLCYGKEVSREEFQALLLSYMGRLRYRRYYRFPEAPLYSDPV